MKNIFNVVPTVIIHRYSLRKIACRIAYCAQKAVRKITDVHGWFLFETIYSLLFIQYCLFRPSDFGMGEMLFYYYLYSTSLMLYDFKH